MQGSNNIVPPKRPYIRLIVQNSSIQYAPRPQIVRRLTLVIPKPKPEMLRLK